VGLVPHWAAKPKPRKPRDVPPVNCTQRGDPIARSPRSGAPLGVPIPRVALPPTQRLGSPRAVETAPADLPSPSEQPQPSHPGGLPPRRRRDRDRGQARWPADRFGHGRTPTAARQWLDFVVPKTAIPPEQHVCEQRPVRPDGDYEAEWDGSCWQVTIFPSMRPSGREQVNHLRECLNRMLHKELETSGLRAGSNVLDLLERGEDADLAYGALQSIYLAGLKELSRQVAMNCVERSHLLAEVCTASKGLSERLAAIKDRKIGALERRVATLAEENRVASERLESFRLVESMLSTKNEEVHRLATSKAQLVEMIKSLQTALHSAEEQLRTSTDSRGCMEESLRSWLPHFDAYSTPLVMQTLEAHAAAPPDPSLSAEERSTAQHSIA
jgi:hypothetical protein